MLREEAQVGQETVTTDLICQFIYDLSFDVLGHIYYSVIPAFEMPGLSCALLLNDMPYVLIYV